MRFRLAVSTFVTMSCVALVGLASAWDDPAPEPRSEAQLAGTEWTVETSADYGISWKSPLDRSGHGMFPVRVDLKALSKENYYQPLTLRSTVGTNTASEVNIEPGTLLAGDPELAKLIKIRMVYSPEGVCAGPVFDAHARSASAIEPHSVQGATDVPPIMLEPGSATTPGRAETVCLEFGVNHTPAPEPHGQVTLAWPLSAEPLDHGSTTSSSSNNTSTAPKTPK